MITDDTIIETTADYVEFRTATTFGCQIIRVYTTLSIPRIVAYSEWVVDKARHKEPMSLLLDDVLEFCIRAWHEAKRPNLVETFQRLASKSSNVS